MLCLNLSPGEYMTIGENVVVQLDRISGDRCKLVVDAPREIAILREGTPRLRLRRPPLAPEGDRLEPQQGPGPERHAGPPWRDGRLGPQRPGPPAAA